MATAGWDTMERKPLMHKFASTPEFMPDAPPKHPELRAVSTSALPQKKAELERLYRELPFQAMLGMPRESVYRRRSRYGMLLPPDLRASLTITTEDGVHQVLPKPAEEEEELPGLTPSLLVASLLAMQSTLLFGYNSGAINGCDSVVFPGHSELEWSLVVSIFCIGGLIGAVAAGGLANSLGRRGGIMMTSYVYIAAGLLMFFAPSILWLIVARFIVGLAAGASTVLVPIYVGEVAPPTLRGLLGALSQFHLVFGILVANILSLPLATETGWRYLFAFTIVPAILQLALSPWLLESPRLLLMRGARKDASAALVKLRGTTEVDDEVNAIISASRNEAPSRAGGVLSNLDSPRVVYGLLIGCGLHLAQQLSGINAVFYYSTAFFEDVGMEDPRMGTILVGAVNVLATVAAIWLMDNCGHKPLLLWSLGGMLISSITVTLALVFASAAPELTSVLCIASIMAFVSFFEFGLGPVAWLLVSLMFTARLRSSAMGLATLLNWSSNFAVGLLYPIMAASLGVYSWLPFTGVLLVSFLGMAWQLVETKDKTIEEIQEEIGNKVDDTKEEETFHPARHDNSYGSAPTNA